MLQKSSKNIRSINKFYCTIKPNKSKIVFNEKRSNEKQNNYFVKPFLISYKQNIMPRIKHIIYIGFKISKGILVILLYMCIIISSAYIGNVVYDRYLNGLICYFKNNNT